MIFNAEGVFRIASELAMLGGMSLESSGHNEFFAVLRSAVALPFPLSALILNSSPGRVPVTFLGTIWD